MRWTILVFALFVLVSCEEIMNVDFAGDSTKNLVVDGSFTTDTIPHQVILSYTGDYFQSTKQEMATGAIVYISDGAEIIPFREKKPEADNPSSYNQVEVVKLYLFPIIPAITYNISF